MLKEILPYDDENDVILFTEAESKKYGLEEGKTVQLEIIKKASKGKPAEISMTILD